MYNPYTQYTITETWAGHIARGSAGGIDWAMPVGTPIFATEAGYVTYIPYNGTGGHTATLIRDPNHSTQFMHLSGFQGGPRNVAEGEVIGWSGGAAGADGSGSSTGPHLHAHSYDFGVRVPPFFLGSAAGIPSNSTSNNLGDDEMAKPRLFKPNSGVAKGIGIALSPGSIASSPNEDYDAAWTSECGPYIECSGKEFDQLCTLYAIPWNVAAGVATNHGTAWNAGDGAAVDLGPLTAALGKATTDAVKAALANVSIDASVAASVAAAVETQLRDEFAAIPGATRAAIIK